MPARWTNFDRSSSYSFAIVFAWSTKRLRLIVSRCSSFSTSVCSGNVAPELKNLRVDLGSRFLDPLFEVVSRRLVGDFAFLVDPFDENCGTRL